jgi:hypothetical protein
LLSCDLLPASLVVDEVPVDETEDEAGVVAPRARKSVKRGIEVKKRNKIKS